MKHLEHPKRFENNEQIVTFYDVKGLKLVLVVNKDAENR